MCSQIIKKRNKPIYFFREIKHYTIQYNTIQYSPSPFQELLFVERNNNRKKDAKHLSPTISLHSAIIHSLTPSLALAGLVTEVILITCQVKCVCTTHSFIKLITVSTVSTK